MLVDKRNLVAFLLVWISMALASCMPSATMQEKMVLDLAARGGVDTSSLRVRSVGSAKDPGIEWSFQRRGMNNFRSASHLMIADSFDTKFFIRKVMQDYPGARVDNSYYLLRGDIALGADSICVEACNIYVLESRSNPITYGAIYAN